MLLFAPLLKNPNRAPISEVAVWIEGETIRYAGPKDELPLPARQDTDQYQIENACLYPGLVNAHCHLELTALEGLKYPGSFVGWIQKILAKRESADLEEWSRAIPKGVMLSLFGGATTIGDHISCQGELEKLLTSPLRGKAFVEVLGVVPEVGHDLLEAALSLRRAYTPNKSLFEILPSPHSVHALTPEVIQKLLQSELPLFSIHLAESEAEQEYFENNGGEMANLIAKRGRPLRREATSGVQELIHQGLLDNRILLIHGNYLSNEELKQIAQIGISIVHCPLSHHYFGHKDFPMEECQKQGINLALGTDSLASSASLSMLEVLRETKRKFPHLDFETIFHMATKGGAQALKMSEEIGEITPGKKADIIGVSLKENNDPLKNLFNAVRVDFSMINGVILGG